MKLTSYLPVLEKDAVGATAADDLTTCQVDKDGASDPDMMIISSWQIHLSGQLLKLD